ncbi:SdpI family protein [Agromyces atrinae]|uniref:SdpI family protein n=1 Tax=Agromyces atrinae TaxID=592376 RepID=UPI001F55F7BC|nr:SdpI family protein [Agromyces atrinae]MCI2956832.1 SdpI family protein [Agromyces atrinae]
MDGDTVGRIIVGLVMIAAGVLVIWLARATASGRVGRNDIAGIRTPSTMATDDAWLAAHIRAKRPTIFAGVASLVTGAAALLPLPTPVVGIGVVAGAGVMIAFVIHGSVVGTAAAREVLARDDQQ